MNKIISGVKSSTFQRMCDGVYKDENNVIVETTKIGSNNYFSCLYNNQIFLPMQNGGSKFGVKQTLNYISEFLMKYDITQITNENINDNLHIRDELIILNNFIRKN